MKLDKPKYDKQRQINSWICCWCGEDHTGVLNGFYYSDGEDTANCRKCGKRNHVAFSVEFVTQPFLEDGGI